MFWRAVVPSSARSSSPGRDRAKSWGCWWHCNDSTEIILRKWCNIQHYAYAWHRICYVCEVTEGIFWRWSDLKSFRDKIKFLQNRFCCFILIPGTNTLLFNFLVNLHKSVTCFSVWIFTIGSVWCWRVDHTARNCLSEGQWRFDGTSFTVWSHLGWYITSELRCVFEINVSLFPSL
jgi:hypothetical protein